MKKQGFFLTIEGIEGVGKSTAVKFIEKFLKAREIPYLVTREPGGTMIAEHIRNVLLTPNLGEPILSDTELLLMFAARAQHIANVIKPALCENKWVVCDRFVDASYAYQGGGRGIPTATITMLDRWIVNEWMPDQTLLLDVDPRIGLARAKHRGEQDRIEQETIEFFERVRAVYLVRSQQDTKRFRLIDAGKALSHVEVDLLAILESYV